ncbi:type II secretion system protein [Candidatus Curtissbacteria bacterium]|nr:type II secretion system protein [Candidatus Curtissbacteria bacterium]
MPVIKLLNCYIELARYKLSYIAKLFKNNITISERKRALTIQQSNNYHPGFTLIELLITISIIGILAAIGTTTYSSSQSKARDAVRKSDLTQIKKTLELVKSDCTGGAYYPVLAGGDEYARFDALQIYLADADLKYMNSVPDDPKDTGTSKYGFFTSSSTTANVCPNNTTPPAQTLAGGTDYMLRALLERGTTDPDSLATFTRCAGKPGMPSAAGGYYYVCND